MDHGVKELKMPSLLSGYWNILKLDEATLRSVKESRDGFWFALKLFVIVGLIVGSGKLIAGLGMVEQTTLPPFVHEIADGLESLSLALPPILAEPVSEIATAVSDLEASLSQYQPPLGKGLSDVIRLLGKWLSTPFNMMGIWLGFMLVIFLFAKAMHGQGSLDQHISLMTLAVAPQVLLLFSYISLEVGGLNAMGPVGRLLVIIAWIWSLVIVTKALSVAHEFSQGHAVKVLLLFVVGVVVLALLGTAVTGFVATGLI